VRSPHEHAIAPRLVSRGLRSHALHVRPRCRQEGVAAAQHRTHALADAGQLESDAYATCNCHRPTHTETLERTSEHDTGIKGSHCCRAQSKSDSHTGDMSRLVVESGAARQQDARMTFVPLGGVSGSEERSRCISVASSAPATTCEAHEPSAERQAQHVNT
jgi:hypothetical protein